MLVMFSPPVLQYQNQNNLIGNRPIQSLDAPLKVNRNIVSPLFAEELANSSNVLPPELIRHNQIARDMYDYDYYNRFKHGGHFFLEPEVVYTLGGQRNMVLPDPYSSPELRFHNFHVSGFTNTPWADWDWPSDAHEGKSVTVSNLNDIYGIVDEFTGRNNARARVYLTPKGAHAAIISHRATPQQFQDSGLFDQLNVDKNYQEIAVQGKSAPQEYLDKGFVPQSAFNVRVSQKDRPGDPIQDFVGFYLGDVGNAIPDPENLRLVNKYHDEAIRRALVDKNINAAKEAAAVLEQGNHLAGLPLKFREPVEMALDSLLKAI